MGNEVLAGLIGLAMSLGGAMLFGLKLRSEIRSGAGVFRGHHYSRAETPVTYGLHVGMNGVMVLVFLAAGIYCLLLMAGLV